MIAAAKLTSVNVKWNSLTSCIYSCNLLLEKFSGDFSKKVLLDHVLSVGSDPSSLEFHFAVTADEFIFEYVYNLIKGLSPKTMHVDY